MSSVRGGFFDEVKSFAENHKVLSIATLGLAVIGYSIGKLAGRAVSWIGKCMGITKKIDTSAQKIFNSTSSKQNTQKGTTSELPVAKEIDSPLKGNADLPIVFKDKESQSSFKIINWRDVNPEICNQVKEMWPKRIEKFIGGVPEGDRIVCITEGNKLVGCVALEQLTITKPTSLVQEIGSQKVYNLNIEINHDYQGKGYGRTVFNKACNLVIEEGALVFLSDMAAHGVGDRLYGGEKTRELFDVYHVLKGSRGDYLLRGKTQEKNSLNYLKIDPNDTYIFSTAVESPGGMNHLINYLEAHPEDMSLIDPSIIRTCEQILKIYKDLWEEEKLVKYNEGLHRLRTALHQSI